MVKVHLFPYTNTTLFTVLLDNLFLNLTVRQGLLKNMIIAFALEVLLP